jgi:uncharacterized OB-fold protein
LSNIAESSRQLPELEPLTGFFWRAGAEGVLLICRCVDCSRYVHPPLPRCPYCHGASLSHSAVSGRGRVASFTVNYQTWVPGLDTPFVFAAVELLEQAELFVLTNIVDCATQAVRIGMPVEVKFERHGDIFLPLFAPVDGP